MDKSQPRSGVFYGWSLCRQRWRPHELRANVVSGTLGGFPGQRSSSVSCLDALLISRESRDNKNLNEPITPKKRGRPITANAEKKREDARLRQQRARRKQKLVKLISFRLVGANALIARSGWHSWPGPTTAVTTCWWALSSKAAGAP